MNNQELEHKFNLIGDPIVRAVVRHLYTPDDVNPEPFECSNTPIEVLAYGIEWDAQKLNYDFFLKLYHNLENNPSYAFTPDELQKVQKAYPELFNSDGSLKESEIKDDAEDIGNFALILDKELRGYVIKYVKRKYPDKKLSEIVRYVKVVRRVVGDTFIWGDSGVCESYNSSYEFWLKIAERLEQDPATKLTDNERKILENPYHEQNNTEPTHIKVEDPKPELNRNEIAWDILMHLITSPKFDGDKKVVDNAFELADAFIKHSHESNNNK